MALENNIPCCYCGCKLERNNISIDHIKPKVRGGIDTMENYIVSCRRCNEVKSGRKFSKWIRRIDVCNVINHIIEIKKHVPNNKYYYLLYANDEIPIDFKQLMYESIG